MRTEVLFTQVADIVRAGWPGATSKRTVKVCTAETYRVSDYWSGGSRDRCAFVKLDTLQSVPGEALPQAARQVNGNPFNLAAGEVTLSPGFCVVENVIFQGKDLGFRIYFHPSNVPPMLGPSTADAIEPRDLRILATFRSLKSGPYRHEALTRLAFTDEDRARLAARGLLKVASNGATAITAEGRIACASERT